MELETRLCRLRPFTRNDRNRLAELADDRRISRNLTDQFPYPYTIGDADHWIELATQQDPVRNFAIEVEDELAGGIGVDPMDGEKRHVAAVGYWLAPGYWNRGIATEALKAIIGYALETFPQVERLEASVYRWNPASGRVLEKCGFHLEATLREAISKDGQTTDEHIYSLFRNGSEQAHRSTDTER
ncbi:MAG: GNAT family N-acetyltransferase [Acidimicrobiia bacterium]